jgi:hypothetical protein
VTILIRGKKAAIMKSLILPLVFAFSWVAAAQSPAAIERGVLAKLKDIEKYGSYSGNYDEDKNDAGNRRDILQYSFPKLKNEMYIATSPDGKLRIYSWDSQTGGTMHDFCNVYQFRGESGRVHASAEQCSHDLEKQGAGAFTTEIFQTDATTGPIYIEASTFIGSTSLAAQFISALRIRGERLDLNPMVIRTAKGLGSDITFQYDFFSVADHPERPVKLVFYDETKKEFRFPVVIEDDETPQGRVTNKSITYRFNGQYFVKVS